MPPNGGAPHGYLRLTDASGDQSGAVLYNQALPASEGLDVTFDQWQYGSTTPANPADGISCFLVDGDTSDVGPMAAFGRARVRRRVIRVMAARVIIASLAKNDPS